MPIDNYDVSFAELSTRVLPECMSEMRVQMSHPVHMSIFSIPGVGVVSLCKVLGITKDFAGAYVLIDEGRPIYVGISKGVIQRLRQHVLARTHFDASLAYRMASAKFPHESTRSVAMADPAFKAAFKRAQENIRTLHAAMVPVSNPVKLYLFEVYCAMELDTGQWNTFATH